MRFACNLEQTLARIPPAGPSCPPTALGVLVLGGYRPVGMDGSEVVDADHVKQAKHAFHAFLPPTPSLGSVGVPIVEHRPPLLPAFEK